MARSCLLAAAVAITLPASAAPDTLLPAAVRLLARGDAAAAYALLRAEEPARAGQPEYDYLLGIAALDAGHVTQSIFALERVVAVQPGNAIAHAELARAHLAAGETDAARAQLKLARRAELPVAAAAAIDRVLGALDQAVPSRAMQWSGYAEAGAGRDSNVNSANNAGEFAIPAFGGLLFTVPDDDRRQSDTFGFGAVGANLQLPIDAAWKLVAAVNGRASLNRHVHEMNTGLVDGTLGVSHTEGPRSLSLAVQSNTAWVSSSVYRRANGVSGQWQHQLDATSQWSAFVQWARQSYEDQRERDADRSVLGAAYARAFASTGTLTYASVYGADERARLDGFAHFGHHAIGARLGVEQQLPQDTTLFAEWRFERRRYGATEPLFDVQRADHQTDVLLGLRWTFARDWAAVPSIRHTAARSNVPLYDHSRTVVQIAVRKEFP